MTENSAEKSFKTWADAYLAAQYSPYDQETVNGISAPLRRQLHEAWKAGQLQRAAECEKKLQEEISSGDASLKCSWMWMQKHKALEDKVQGLVDALQIAKRDFKNWLPNKDAREAAIAHIDKALAAFGADDLGVGL